MHADHVTGAALHQSPLRQPHRRSGGIGRQPAQTSTIGDGQIDRIWRSAARAAHRTPGHTNGCMTYVTGDRAMAFTGDCLLIRGTGRTDFQQGELARDVPFGPSGDLQPAG